MTESEFTAPILRYLRDNGCVVFKHCDRFTTGIPDISCTTDGRTWWLEIKKLKRGETPYDRAHLDEVQFYNMWNLAKVGQALYIIRQLNGQILVTYPGFLFNLVMPMPKLYLEPRDWEALRNGPVLLTDYRDLLKLMRPQND